MNSSQFKALLLLVVVVVPGQSKPVTGDVVGNGMQQIKDEPSSQVNQNDNSMSNLGNGFGAGESKTNVGLRQSGPGSGTGQRPQFNMYSMDNGYMNYLNSGTGQFGAGLYDTRRRPVSSLQFPSNFPKVNVANFNTGFHGFGAGQPGTGFNRPRPTTVRLPQSNRDFAMPSLSGMRPRMNIWSGQLESRLNGNVRRPGRLPQVNVDSIADRIIDGLDDFGAGRSGSGFNVNGPGLVRRPLFNDDHPTAGFDNMRSILDFGGQLGAGADGKVPISQSHFPQLNTNDIKSGFPHFDRDFSMPDLNEMIDSMPSFDDMRSQLNSGTEQSDLHRPDTRLPFTSDTSLSDDTSDSSQPLPHHVENIMNQAFGNMRSMMDNGFDMMRSMPNKMNQAFGNMGSAMDNGFDMMRSINPDMPNKMNQAFGNMGSVMDNGVDMMRSMMNFGVKNQKKVPNTSSE